MPLQDLLQIAIVGALLSGLIQLIKAKLGTSSLQTKLLTALLALAVGAGYWLLRDTNLLKTIAGILAASQIVYGFILNKPSQE